MPVRASECARARAESSLKDAEDLEKRIERIKGAYEWDAGARLRAKTIGILQAILPRTLPYGASTGTLLCAHANSRPSGPRAR